MGTIIYDTVITLFHSAQRRTTLEHFKRVEHDDANRDFGRAIDNAMNTRWLAKPRRTEDCPDAARVTRVVIEYTLMLQIPWDESA